MAALFAKVLNMSLTGSAVILAVLLVRLLLRRAPRSICYLLWSVVLFRLLCPVSLSLPGSALSIAVQRVDSAQVTTQIGRTSTITYLPAATAAPEGAALSFQAVLPWLWLAGVILLASGTIWEFFRLRKDLKEAVLLKNRVYLSDRIPSPFVLGLWKPKIYLPSGTPRGEYQYIISHERCHIHRGDHIVKLLAYVALCLHWFNPLVWLAFSLDGQDMEMSCDEAVVRIIGSRIRPAYAQALVHQATGSRRFAATPLSFGAGDVTRRVRHLAKWRRPKTWLTILALIVCIAALAALALNPQAEARTYPGVAMNLPENMTLDTGEDGNQIITDGAQTLGGIRQYKAPDYHFDVSNIVQWLTDMGLPQLNDGVQRDRMIEGSTNSGWLASFFHPDEEETQHYFFIQEDTVTELWFYSQRVHPDAMQIIKDSVTLGQPSAPAIAIPQKNTLSTEAYALYRCRVVLDKLQTYNAYKVHTLRENLQTGEQTEITYWRAGERWMRCATSPVGPIWSKAEGNRDSIPWLFSYQWNDQEVVCVGTTPMEDGERIEFAVQAPYDDSSTDTYYVYFHFDREETFQYAKISAFYRNGEMLDQYDYTMQILSLDEETILKELDAQ